MPRKDVQITVTDDGTAQVITLAGELDIFCAGRAGVALNGAVRRPDGAVVVDLTPLTFIDSSGLALLANAARRMERAGRGFAVVAPAGPPRRAIELSRLARVLRVADDRGSADVVAPA